MNSLSNHNASLGGGEGGGGSLILPAPTPDGCTAGRGAVSHTQVEYDSHGDLGARDTTYPPPPAPAAPRQQGRPGGEQASNTGGDGDAVSPRAGLPHGHGLRERGAAPPRRWSDLLNAIEARFSSEIEQFFDEYLAAIGITVVMGRSVEDTRHLISRHLSYNGIHRVHGDNPPPWEIVQSPLGGRGVVATRDLQPGDLVLIDAPLVVGSRAGSDSSCPLVCVGCHRAASESGLRACPRGCRLPVCLEGACHEAPQHQLECGLLQRWRPSGDPGLWSAELLRASAPVRCLALPPEQREILASMQSHHGRQHAFEVDLLLRLLQERPTADEERFMRLACCVMDANAFRMAIPCQDSWLQSAQAAGARPSIGVLRGLFPLGALLNHGCTPNTRHAHDALGRMVVRCVREVRAGQELTVTYSALLWGTPARRQHLLRTKHFLCGCARCQDPTEGGTCLAALPCPARPCPGPLLPCAPLSLGGEWRCEACGLQVPAARASLLQSVLGGLLGTLYPKAAAPPPPDVIQQFLQDHGHVLPPNNHISVELKADMVWGFGHRDGFTFPELSADQLRLKDDLCCQLLSVLSALQAGQCFLAGMLHYERYCTIMERVRRDPELLVAVAREALEAIETAYLIIGEDSGCPPELQAALLRARQTAPAPAPLADSAAPDHAMACRHFLLQFGQQPTGAVSDGSAHQPPPPNSLYSRS